MICYIYFVKNFDDLTLFIDQKSLAGGAHVLFAVHRFLDPNAVFLDDGFFGVGDQSVRQFEFRNEFLMRLLAIDRNADNLDILLVKLIARIPERTCLLRSARRRVFGIEPKHDTFAFEILEAHGIAVLVVGSKIRSLIAFFQHNYPQNC